jgi:tetratricopeptide (TPR) repeat protein
MKNKTFVLLVITVITAISCNRKIDFSNPKEVIQKYYELNFKNKYKESFKYIADTSKSILTQEEYLDYYKEPDSLKDKFIYKVIEINQLPINVFYPNYRRFEIKASETNKKNKKVIIDYGYRSIINKNNKWKILWNKHLLQVAEGLSRKQKFNEAIDLLNKIINYNPLDGETYRKMAWCYFRLNFYDESEKYAKKAQYNSPKEIENYNLLAAIYYSKGLSELAIENLKKGIELCNSDSLKCYFLSNMSINLLGLNRIAEAKEVLFKALKLSPNATHPLLQMAYVYKHLNQHDSCLFFFGKAIQSKPMEDNLEKDLYYDYAIELIQIADNNTKDLYTKNKMYQKAKIYVLKALDLDPSNEEYKNTLLNKLNKVI